MMTGEAPGFTDAFYKVCLHQIQFLKGSYTNFVTRHYQNVILWQKTRRTALLDLCGNVILAVSTSVVFVA